MADGTTWAREPTTLSQILKTDDVLVASCEQPGCGAQSVVSAGHGIPSQLRHASIARLEQHLRCACGARRGALSVRPYWGPRPATKGCVFLFVV
jgi:hypothetical protein